MEVLFDILYAAGAVLLLILGLLGCVVPVIPGPALSYAALLLLLPSRFAPSLGVCVWFGIGCAAVLVLDTIVPAVGAKKFRCSRWGVAGCIIGTVIGQPLADSENGTVMAMRPENAGKSEAVAAVIAGTCHDGDTA